MHISLHFPQTLPVFPGSALWQAVRARATRGAQRVQHANTPVQTLAKGSTFTLQRPQGLRVECLEGCVWVTLDHDTRDTVLEAGESYCPDHQSRVLVHALAPSSIRISPAPKQ